MYIEYWYENTKECVNLFKILNDQNVNLFDN